MVIYDKELSKQLEAVGIPVLYNQIVDSTVKTPCITYEPMNNTTYLEGFTGHSNLFYSKLDYYIRL